MTEKITAIVLDITRHNDKLDIVTLYSRTRGRISFLSATGSGKSQRLRQSRLQPLAIIDTDVKFNPAAELQRLGQFSLHNVWHDLYFHPIKRMIVLFISEFLNKFLRASMPDEALWDFIFRSLVLLDNMTEGIADFHIAFLSSLLPFAGIQPDFSDYENGDAFNMESATFFAPTHHDTRNYILSPMEAKMAALICRINFYNIRVLKLDRQRRIAILQRLLQYYSIHFPGSGNLKSLDIIREIFD